MFYKKLTCTQNTPKNLKQNKKIIKREMDVYKIYQ